ncbi:caveolae-associated protein 2-like [Pristis pectinata]|uniref:caveolae-associated protein 2-like n=1 Tax=Pristis pectinata TaxID=685728 RepID=UPI00223CFA90|nr:caveolae-associated protein 2-like [Pristis pectinata]
MGEDGVQAEKSTEAVQGGPEPSPPSSPSQGSSVSPSPAPGSVPAEALREGSQVNAITVLALLDKLVNMLDTVQDNQRKMEQRQIGVESSVRGIQSDLTKLSKSHSTTSNTVNKLLDKSRKVSANVKEMRERLDKQTGQVKKLENNQAQLLKKNNFRVLIFQDEAEIPASVFEKPKVDTAEEEGADENKGVEVSHPSLELSSDEDIHDLEDNEELHDEEKSEKLEQSRAAKIKRSSLKKVDSIKKAFSRENIEKRMNKFGTKIVSPERREKIKKSLSPNQQKSQSGKSSSFKVTPMTFKVKKSKNGETPPQSPSDAVVTLEADASGPTEGDLHPEVHLEISPGTLAEDVKEVAEKAEEEMREVELEMESSKNRGVVMKAESTEEPEILLETLPDEDQQEGRARQPAMNIELHIEEPDEPAVLQIQQTA